MTLPHESSPGQLWKLPEVGPDSRYRMEDRLYPECRPAIGWPDFREAYMQALQEDEESHDYVESFYRMRKEQWLLEEAFVRATSASDYFYSKNTR